MENDSRLDTFCRADDNSTSNTLQLPTLPSNVTAIVYSPPSMAAIAMMHPELHNRPLRVGAGWRVGVKSTADTYCALVGGDRWAVELTMAEWSDFCRAIRQIEAALASLSEQLMEGESVTLEQETERLLTVATGKPPKLELYLQLRDERNAEGYWLPDALPGLFEAIRQLQP